MSVLHLEVICVTFFTADRKGVPETAHHLPQQETFPEKEEAYPAVSQRYWFRIQDSP